MSNENKDIVDMLKSIKNNPDPELKTIVHNLL